MTNVSKGWYCENCDRDFNFRGVPKHRMVHRDRKELLVMRTWKYVYTYDYREAES